MADGGDGVSQGGAGGVGGRREREWGLQLVPGRRIAEEKNLENLRRY